MSILNLLAREPMHGYRLVKSLAEVPGLVVTEGTIYPLLSRLRTDGWVETRLEPSAEGPARKVYALTVPGHERRTAMNAAWTRIAAALERLRGPDLPGAGPAA